MVGRICLKAGWDSISKFLLVAVLPFKKHWESIGELVRMLRMMLGEIGLVSVEETDKSS